MLSKDDSYLTPGKMINIKCRALVILISILLITMSVSGELFIVFRYDDLSADKPGIRDTNNRRRMIWEAEQALDALFAKYGFEYVISVIPRENDTSFGEDFEKVAFIKKGIMADRIEVAQHGFSHINHASRKHTNTDYTTRRHTNGEFRERDYKSQLRDIKLGKEILHNSCGLSNITTFVPPYNGWDENTAEILKQCSFTILSADRFYYYKSTEGLTLIPLTASLQMLESIISSESLPQQGVMVIIFHPKEIVKLAGEENHFFGINRLDKLLSKLSSIPTVNVVTFKQLASRGNDLTIKRYRLSNQLLRENYFWRKLLPKIFLPGEKRRAFYLPAEEYAKSLMFWRMASAGLVVGLIVLGFVIRRYLKMVLSLRWYFGIEMTATGLFLLSLLKEIQLVYRGYYITAISAIPGLIAVSFVFALVINTARGVFLVTTNEYLNV